MLLTWTLSDGSPQHAEGERKYRIDIDRYSRKSIESFHFLLQIAKKKSQAEGSTDRDQHLSLSV